MKTPPAPSPRRLVSAFWKIIVALFPLGAGLSILAVILPRPENLSDPATLMIRIAAGIVISALTLTVIACLMRFAVRKRLRDVGLTSIRAGWRLALWGMLIWLTPAAGTFGALTFIGAPLTVTVPPTEFAQTILLLFLAVLLTEALPEEAVFRGYITTVLSSFLPGWWAIIIQALLFTLFAGLLRQNLNPLDVSLFLTMGIGFGYLRMISGSIWMPIGFHAAFQTGAQLILTHDVLHFAGDTAAAVLALGVVPFTVAGIIVSTTGPVRRML